MRFSLALVIVFSSGWLSAATKEPGPPSEQILVAVASNFAAPMQQLSRRFEDQTGHTVQLAYGASGKFYAQIIHGAPFDVFFSADAAKPVALEKRGDILAGSRFTYAVGRLVLWSRDETLINNATILNTDRFSKLAIANPKLAPYGLAAQQTLEQLELRNQTESKWVMGENIAQTYQFVSSGNAQLGFVAQSQVFANGQLRSGSAWPVPAMMHQPIEQQAVILKRAAGREVVIEFMTFIRSASSAEVIRSYGYEIVD